MVEIEFHLDQISPIVLHHHNQILRFVTPGSIIQPEFRIFQQIAVIRFEYRPVLQFQGTRSIVLKIPDGIDCSVKIPFTLHFTAYFRRFTLGQLFGDRHGFHRKRVLLLHIQLRITGGNRHRQ